MSLFDNHSVWNGTGEPDPETMDEIEKDEEKLMLRLGLHIGKDVFNDGEDEDEEELDAAKEQAEAKLGELKTALAQLTAELSGQKEALETLLNEVRQMSDDLPDVLSGSFLDTDLENLSDSLDNAVSELEDCLEELDDADSAMEECIDDLDLI